MKKFTSICLAVMILLSTISTNIFAADSHAFKDVNGTEYFASEAEALSKLDILEGYEDGSFGATKNITRAEMAAIICRMMGKENVANSSKGKTPFDDVVDTHWASGYINVAAENKIINGDGNGKFRPEDSVSYEEAVKMVVCSIGLADNVVVDKNDWSKGYLEIADKNGITKNLKGKKGESATRADIAVMSYSALAHNIIKPEISLESGTYTGSKTVKLTTTTDDSEIYYTIDGSTPTNKSMKYTKAITISKDCVLKAITVVDSVLYSDESVAEYTIKRSSGGGGGGGGGSSRPTTYSLSFGTIENGSVNSTAAGKYAANTVIDLSATPAEGYLFEKWEATAGTFTDATSATTKFTMPSGNVEIVAKFVQEEEVSSEVETLFGTDPSKNDTDDDGLSDYVEIYITGTDPLLKDSDDNGVSDADEDSDGDKLTNITEIELGTNLVHSDSDADGLNDYDETNLYNTDPVKADTDGDSLIDGDEILLGLDPLLVKTDGTTLDSERKFEQTISDENISEELTEDNEAVPSLTATVSGNINRNISITKSNSNDFNDSRALVGNAIDITGEDLSSGKLTFSIENELEMLSLQDSSEEFSTHLICKYNEDGSTSFLETSFDVSTNSVTAEITESGTYFVADIKALFDELGLALPTVADLSLLSDPEVELMDIDIDENSNGNSNENVELQNTEEIIEPENVEIADADTEKVTLMAANGAMAQADIVFIIDTTGSMSGEIYNVKTNVGYFVDALKEKGISAGLALVEYRDIEEDGYDTTKVHKNGTSNWFYDMDAYKNKISSSLYASGGGDTPESVVDALETARLLDMRASAGKIFILVTDANYKVGNRYGIPSMAAEIELLKNAGVNCSVVTGSGNKNTYYDLYNGTEGIYVNINGNFYNELMTIADKIGEEIVGDGYWIYLQGPVPVPVRLDAIPEEGSTADTDDDGIYDVDELESVVPTGEIDLDEIIEKMSRGAITGTDYGVVKMYKYKSSPVDVDTDFDGIEDSVDTDAKNNNFEGTLKGTIEEGINVKFNVDYRDFVNGSNTKYQQDISTVGALLSTLAYDSELTITSGGDFSGQIDKIYSGFGLKDYANYNMADDSSITDDDLSEVSIGHRLVSYNGAETEVFVVSIRGTNGTIQEWSSNFDVGADTDSYWDRNNSMWRNKQNHKGFDVAANRIYDYIIDYIDDGISNGLINPTAKRSIFITGHSRGAAIANIVGSLFEDSSSYQSYTYTFATPYTTTDEDATNYKTIFNVINSDDLIPELPLQSWGFKKYGINKSDSIKDNYENKWFGAQEGTWEWLINANKESGKVDYNYNGSKESTVKAFGEMVGNREDLYKYSSSEKSILTLKDEYDTMEDAENAVNAQKEKYGDRISRFCSIGITTDTKFFTGKTYYKVEVYQTPAFLTMVLADMAGNEKRGGTLGFDVAKDFSNAKNKFVASAIDQASDFAWKGIKVGKAIEFFRLGGITHAHWPETYYLLARYTK